MPIPPKPRDVQDGDFKPVVHDEQVIQEVLARILRVGDTFTASISAGAPFFRLGRFWVGDLELVTDEGEGPHGEPISYWEETKVGESDGPTPLVVENDQRVHVEVALLVPSGQLPPGPLKGTVTLRGSASSLAIDLTSTYLAVDPRTAIGQKWHEMGEEAFFGRPFDNEHFDDTGPGETQNFENGTLYQISGHGVFYFTPPAFEEWRGGSVTGDIIHDEAGLPLEDTIIRSDGVQIQRCQFGALVVPEDGFGTAMYGDIYANYLHFPGDLADPGSQPAPGLPLEDEQPIVDGRSQRFQSVDYYLTASTGARAVGGEIRDHWQALGGAGSAGFLGLPSSDEFGVTNPAGAFGTLQHFQGGVIAGTGRTGYHEVHGLILGRWAELGYQSSHFGFPVSDEMPWTNPANGLPGRVSFFENGQIGWTPQDGALDLPPEEITMSQQVLTPPGTALGGTVQLTMRSDGSYAFGGHMHDSGFDPYAYRIRAVVRTGTGVDLPVQHSGQVAGTSSSGSRDDDWIETGFETWIRENWPDVRNSTMIVSKSYEDTGIGGTVEDLVVDLVTFLALDVVVGPELALILALGKELTGVTESSFAGPGGLPGVLVASGVVWLFGRGAIVAATVAGVAAGAVVDAMIRHRSMTDEEMVFATQVFQGTLPPAGRIILTNLTHDGGRKYTWPLVDGGVLLNLGDAYDNPADYSETDYSAKGQVFIHELTHAWQIHNTSFSPGLICQGAFGSSNYDYGAPGPAWSSFGLEQQGRIVDQWFGGNRPQTDAHPAGTGNPMDKSDIYFGYIFNNIQEGNP